MTNSSTRYSVTIWETIGISLGALGLSLAAASHLAMKYLNNNLDPIRAETIARSLIDYKIPGGSKGIYGINIGGGQIAIVSSLNNLPNTDNPEVKIIISKIPPTQAENLNPNSFSDSQFQAISQKTLNYEFCGKPTDLLIEQGQQTLSDGVHKSQAAQYTLKTTVGSYQREVIINTLGQDSQQKAEFILKNLKCIVTEY